MSLLLLLSLCACPQGRAAFVPRVEPASEEGLQAIGKFRPAAGVQVELFAAEPRLANPVSFCIDNAGTVFVAEAFRILSGVTDIRRHVNWLDDDLAARSVADRVAYTKKWMGADFEAEYCTAGERVRRLVDSDGDGVADEDTVFAEGFNDPAAGIGAGVLSYEGEVFYTCIPDLWKLLDQDGDGVAETQVPLSSGYGVHIALYGHDLHGLRIGPDRRLYFSCGDRGFRVETENGLIEHSQCGAVLRCELDGSGLEVYHTGLRNPQELTFDDLGNLWTGDNNSDGGDRARWVNVVQGGDSGWRYPYQWITEPVARGPWNDERLWYPHFPGQAAYIVPPVANLGDGPSGLTCYPGTGLSPAYQDHFFLCDFRGDAAASGIHTFTVEPRGASWALGPVSPFLWGSLVTDCDFGPDGALWFSDWVYGWEQTGKGRLYRAFLPETRDSALVQETRALLAGDFAALSTDELVELLGHPDRRVRQEAHFALADQGALERLEQVASDPERELLARVHALWGLWVSARRDPAATAALRTLAAVDEPELRAQALHALGDVRAEGATAEILRGLLDESPRVRYFAAQAAGSTGPHEALDFLVSGLETTGEQDPNLRHALVMGLAGCALPEDLDRLAGHDSRDVRMGVALVWRRQRSPSLARLVLDPDPLVALEAVRAIHDLGIEPVLDAVALAGVDEGRVAVGERAFVGRVLNAAYRKGRASVLLGCAAREDFSLETRIEALDLLAHWEQPAPRDRVTNEWRPLAARGTGGLAELAVRLGSGPVLQGPDELVAAFARFAAAARAKECAGLLAAIVADPQRKSAAKAAALEALEALGADNLVASVHVALGDRDGRVRAAALERLERLAPQEALQSLAPLVEQGEIAERRAAYAILGRRGGPTTSALLQGEVSKLLADRIPAELTLDLVLAAEARHDPGLEELLARHASDRDADDPLSPYLDGLFGGDASRGNRVFERVDLSCTRCHAWWPDAAERVGPDLHAVGQRLTRLQILESIVHPNARTTPGYGAQAFFLKDGRVVAGRVVEESDTLVRLFDSNNDPIALDPAEVEERRADLSAMPEDLYKMISREDMRDLIEYLAGL